MMDPVTVSAHFAAYTWYEDCHTGKKCSHEEATKFARENWQAFLGHAHEGLGCLLIQVGRLGRKPRQAGSRKRDLAPLSATVG